MKSLFPTGMLKSQARSAMQGRFGKALCITVIPSLLISVITIAVLSLIPQVKESFELVISGNFDSVADRAVYVETITHKMLISLQVVMLLFEFLNVGSVRACLDMLRGREVKIKTIFSYYGKWYIAAIYPGAMLIVTRLCAGVISYLSQAPVDGALVDTVTVLLDIIIYFISFKLMFLNYVLADNNCSDFIGSVKAAWKMTSFNSVVNAIVLAFSFIGWFVLGTFTMGLVYIFVIPYFSLSVAALYNATAQFNSHTKGTI